MKARLAAALLAALATAPAAGQLLNPAPYVPARSPYELATGDVQFRQAYEAAFVAALTDGTWASLFSSDAKLARSESCLPTPDRYPFPANPVGALYDALQRGSVRAGYVVPPGNAALLTPGGLPWLVAPPGGVGAPSGLVADLYSAVFTRLGAAYRRSYLTTSWAGYRDTSSALEALYSGAIDTLVGATSAIDTYKSLLDAAGAPALHRAYLAAPSQCFPWIASAPVYVAPSSTWTSTSDLLAAVAAGAASAAPVKVGVLSTAAGASLTGLVSNNAPAGTNVTAGLLPLVYPNATALATALVSGAVDASYPGAAFVAGAGPTAKLLDGWLGYTAPATYFRLPALLAPAASSANVAPSGAVSGLVPRTGPMPAYPLNPAVTDPVALGDAQLRQAMLAATNRVIRSGAAAAAWAPTGFGGYASLDTCSGDPAAFPFPPASAAAGAFKTMLDTGLLRTGFYTGLNLTAYNGAVLQGTYPDGTVFGLGNTYMDSIAAALTAAYGRTITVAWSVASGGPGFRPIDAVYNLLFNRVVDVVTPTVLVGGDINSTITRSFVVDPLPCESYAVPSLLFTRIAETKFTDTESLQAYLAGGGKLKIGAQTAASGLAASAVLGPNAAVTILNDTPALFAQLAAGTLDAVFRSSPPASLSNVIHTLPGPPVSIAAYTFFMRYPALAADKTAPYSSGPGSPAPVPAYLAAGLPPSGGSSGDDSSLMSAKSANVGLGVALGIVLAGLAAWGYKATCGRRRVASTRLSGRPAVELQRKGAVDTLNPVSDATAAALPGWTGPTSI